MKGNIMNNVEDKHKEHKTRLILFLCYMVTLFIAWLSSFLLPALDKGAADESLRITIYLGLCVFLVVVRKACNLKRLIIGIVISILFITLFFISFGLRYVRIPIS
jgi:hypothetical protein